VTRAAGHPARAAITGGIRASTRRPVRWPPRFGEGTASLVEVEPPEPRGEAVVRVALSGIARRDHRGYSCEHAPAGPVAAALSTGVTQVVPSHWYHTLSADFWTQVRGGTARPSVADWHQP